LVKTTRWVFRAENSERMTANASRRVAPVSGASWAVTSSRVTSRSDW
jgi:hypothetical protein